MPISTCKSFLGGGRSGLVGYKGQSKGIQRGTGNYRILLQIYMVEIAQEFLAEHKPRKYISKLDNT